MNFTNHSDAGLKVGDKVKVSRRGTTETATVAYVGNVEFAPPSKSLVGLILTGPTGKNDGMVQGVRYFDCEKDYGLFVRSSTVQKVNSRGNPDGNSLTSKEVTDDTVAPLGAPTHGQQLLDFKENLRGLSIAKSVAAQTSRSTMSKISTWTKEERVVGRRKNKIKGKKGFLIYNKVVGEADGGKELSVEEFEKLKNLYSESWNNRLYVYWLRVKPSRRDCRRIRPQNKCHCGHTFKSHEWWDEKNRKGRCRVPGCHCECFEYLHYQGSMGFNCKCKHSALEHRTNGVPSACKVKGCPCTGFETTFSCACGYPYSAHRMHWETVEERRAAGLLSDEDKVKERIRKLKSNVHGCGKCAGCKCGMACKRGSNNPWQSNGAGFEMKNGKSVFTTTVRKEKKKLKHTLLGGGGKRFK